MICRYFNYSISVIMSTSISVITIHVIQKCVIIDIRINTHTLRYGSILTHFRIRICKCVCIYMYIYIYIYIYIHLYTNTYA